MPFDLRDLETAGHAPIRSGRLNFVFTRSCFKHVDWTPLLCSALSGSFSGRSAATTWSDGVLEQDDPTQTSPTGD